MLKETSMKIVKEKMRSIGLKSNHLHVLSYKNEWAIKSAGLGRVDKIFPNKVDAITNARLIAKKRHASNIIIHRKDGSIGKLEVVVIKKLNKR